MCKSSAKATLILCMSVVSVACIDAHYNKPTAICYAAEVINAIHYAVTFKHVPDMYLSANSSFSSILEKSIN